MYDKIRKSPSLDKWHATRPGVTFLGRRVPARTRKLLRNVTLSLGVLVVLFLIAVRRSQLDASLVFSLGTFKLMRDFNPLDPAILDVTRSRRHRAIIRPSVTYELHSLENTGVFAEWYGNPGQVGPSPFDYEIPDEWQGRLSRRKMWAIACSDDCTGSTDSEICDLAAALRSSPHRTVSTVKPGRLPSWNRDAAITLASEDSATDLVSARKASFNIRILDECAGPNCTASMESRSGGITLARHAFELVNFFEYHKLAELFGSFLMHLFGHLPYAADPKRCYPLRSWQDKTVDILDVDGVMGTARSANRVITPEEFRHAKLCLFDSTPKKRVSREWIKAMLSGCVIVSDMPTESEEILTEAIIIRDTSAGSAAIKQIIDDALKDTMALQKKALRAFAYARRHHTPAYQAGYILQLTELHRSGERGYDFPLPFAAVCRVYPDGTKPGWCE